MSISPRRLPALAAGAVLLFAALPAPAARAQGASKEGAYVQMILKDGFVLQGKVRREGNYEIEGGQSVVFMPTGFFFLDDGPRRQYFSPSLIQQPPTEIKPPNDDVISPKNTNIAVDPHPIPSVDQVLDVSPFDGKWERTVKFRAGLTKERKRHERLVALTPYYAHTQATQDYAWPAMYLTRELGPDVIRKLLSSHPDYADDPMLKPQDRADHHLSYCRFMIQAGFDDEALAELGRLAADPPAAALVKAQADALRTTILQLQCSDQLENIKRMHNAGQFTAVRQKLANFDDKNADANTLTKCNELRDVYKTADKATADATRFLTDLPKDLGTDAQAAALAEAAAALLAELQPDVLPRLDAFLGQARQAERQRAAHQAPSMGPAPLLALAVTGWLGALPDPTPDRAVRLWHARQFVLQYLAADGATRKSLLDSYQKSGGAATLDDVTRLIPLLPPPEPEPLNKIGDKAVEMTAGPTGAAVKYSLQLPPEYRHSRNYPVLIVLHQSGEEPEDMLKRWADAAALNGYILVAPEWSKGMNGVYGYSEREHAVVLETLRDLRRRFAVDSDRVFLFGMGVGGEMAYDVGLSHPDLFAGVLPMSCYPDHFSLRYARNAEYLPFYVVDGDRSGDVHKQNTRQQVENWVNKYPMMWIQYKGRGVEWYGGEVPTIFDWMRGKKREFPLEQLGGSGSDGRCFVTQRATDDSFYWLTTDDVQQRHLSLANPPARLGRGSTWRTTPSWWKRPAWAR